MNNKIRDKVFKSEKEEREYGGPVGEVHRSVGTLPAVPLLGEVVVGTAGHTVYL